MKVDHRKVGDQSQPQSQSQAGVSCALEVSPSCSNPSVWRGSPAKYVCYFSHMMLVWCLKCLFPLFFASSCFFLLLLSSPVDSPSFFLSCRCLSSSLALSFGVASFGFPFALLFAVVACRLLLCFVVVVHFVFFLQLLSRWVSLFCVLLSSVVFLVSRVFACACSAPALSFAVRVCFFVTPGRTAGP